MRWGHFLEMIPPVETIDVRHDGRAGIVAVYVIRHARGALLIDCGPGSTLPTLLFALRAVGLEPHNVTDVLLTHIHLDHAGAAGWWAQQGAQIHVHPVGAPHLLNPDKLLTSARRIYGGEMERLWGDFLPVPAGQLIQHHDNETFAVGGQSFFALDTPGHAEHHFAYLFEDVCFSGDAGGVRVNGLAHVRAPTPPPEIHFEKWHVSIARLRRLKFKWLAPTHFGMYGDVEWHLDRLERALDEMDAWLKQAMADAPPVELFRTRFAAFLDEQARADGYDSGQAAAYGEAAGSNMSADGVYRYWNKYRASASL